MLELDELFLLSKLLQVELAVKCGTTIGKFFETDTGGPPRRLLKHKQFYLLPSKNNVIKQ